MNNMRILVVSESPVSLEETRGFIQAQHDNVDTSSDSVDAIEHSGERGFNILVLDLAGKSPHSLAALKNIYGKASPEWIIILADDKCRAFAKKKPYCENCIFIKKPVDFNELEVILKSISEVLKLRHEVSEKSRQVSHLEVVNEILIKTLLPHDDTEYLWNIARIIHERLGYFNVNIFIVNDSEKTLELQAFVGGFGDDYKVGFSLKFGEGIVGWVAENRDSLLSGDVRKELRRIQGFSFEENMRSELGVPIIFEDKVFGVLHVGSLALHAFSFYDVTALKTVSDQMALLFENKRLSRKLSDAYTLVTTINDTIPLSIVLVNKYLHIEYVNQTFCDTLEKHREELLDRPILDFFSVDIQNTVNFEHKLHDIIKNGLTTSSRAFRHQSPDHLDKILNITIVRVQSGEHPLVMILIHEVTEYSKKTQQLSLLREISIAMQGVFERDKLLHLILTSVTANFAIGFNRAFIFLVDKKRHLLSGIMGVGPMSRDEAHRIWYELSANPSTLQDYLEQVNQNEIDRSPIRDMVETIRFNLDYSQNILIDTIKSSKPIHVFDAHTNPKVDDEMRQMIATDEFISIPLVGRGEVIGVLFADNAYSGQPITEEAIEELTMFASSAALAIEKTNMIQIFEEKVMELGKAYSELERTHDMLIRHEKLAAIGEVSARLAHEIRNPLATIGGFAKSIPRKYDDRDITIRNANIIVEEVQRLEHILSNVLDFTKTGTPKKTMNDLNELVINTIKMMEAAAKKNNIVIDMSLAEDKLETGLDRDQIIQVLINIMQNAINAMMGGGAMGISTGETDTNYFIRIIDTGVGIPEEFFENIFDPFFTTHDDGTGLGLSISQSIMSNHKGRLDFSSTEGEGTTVTILLPKSNP